MAYGLKHVLIYWMLVGIAQLTNTLPNNNDNSNDDNVVLKSNANTHVPKSPHPSRSKRSVMVRLTYQEKADALAVHNQYRATEFSSNMKYMVWNNILAEMAQEWADDCSWGHGQPERDNAPYDNLGQNLLLTTGVFTVGVAIKTWYEEKKHSTYGTGEYISQCPRGKFCGHYTQIVWAESYELGCAHKLCASLTASSLTNVNYFVCNYGPAGNFMRKQLYAIGPKCTECGSGKGWCKDYLCVDSCTNGDASCDCQSLCYNCATYNKATCSCTCAAGWTETDCNQECKDNKDRCGASQGKRSVSNCQDPLVSEICPLLCGSCEAAVPNDKKCSVTGPGGKSKSKSKASRDNHGTYILMLIGLTLTLIFQRC